ncbi:MAG: hypothetical protein R3D25_01810 [Geminicoccaceae bacterium]
MGLHAELDEAARIAVREMIAHICRRTGLGREQAYMLCSLAADLRVTQTVDGEKGCHMIAPRRISECAAAARKLASREASHEPAPRAARHAREHRLGLHGCRPAARPAHRLG